MVKSIGQAADETRTLIRDVDRQLEPLIASIKKTSDEAGKTLQKIRIVAGAIENISGDDSVVVYKLNKTLDEMERASRSLRLLADTVEQQPESLIFGKKNLKGGTK
jgi:paraquat-inducible protein B